MDLNRPSAANRYEIRPGFDALRYLGVYGLLTTLATRVAQRETRMFVEIASNIDRHCLSEGQFEKGVISLVDDLVASTGHTELLVDVGANIGNHSIGWADTFKQVHSIEPHPALFHVLQANIVHNQKANITAYNIGLAGEDISGELVESLEHHELGRIKGRSVLAPEVFGLSTETFSRAHKVTLKDAQTFIGAFGETLNKAFIKIDVEGMEQEIVEAILPLLDTYRPIVAFEWFVDSQPDLERIARSLVGYDFWGIASHDKGPNRPLRALKMLAKGRQYSLQKLVQGQALEQVYTLALLIPK